VSFRRYPSYKPSGVEWLGDVPSHWEVRRLRWLFDIRKRISGTLGLDVFSITQQGIRVKDIESNEGQMALDYSNYQLVEPGDFAMNPMDLLTGGVDIATTRGVTSPDYRVVALRPSGMCPQYFLNVFQNVYRRQIFFAFGQGSAQLGRWRLPTDQFRDFCFPVPPASEQAAIAAFLDRETAKIDALVAEQERLIELLKEKRQAVISHAVTKGLNPDAPMKPSGIEWLGDVPAHWRVSETKRHVSVLSGYAFPSAEFSSDGDDPRLLRGVNVGVATLRWDETVRWRRSPGDGLDEYELHAGDLVIGMDRPLISEGMRVAQVRPDDLPCLLLQRVARLSSTGGIDLDYLELLLASDMFVAHFAPETTGVSVPHISPDQIGTFVIPVPPVAEQREIANHLRDRMRAFTTLAGGAQQAVQLLLERRAVLVAAAVTGQIDVRGLAVPAVA